MKRGSIIVMESSVYPGATEDIVKPILERESMLKCGFDFKLGCSPERVNPGDEVHNLDKIIKIVAGMDEETINALAELYGMICDIYKAKNIKTAEAAKLIENIQRDLNIALINEFSLIFHAMGLDTRAVLEAANTKWNFLKFHPGIVGGYCIPVSPYYLSYKATKEGYIPQLILYGRSINEYMPEYIAKMAINGLLNTKNSVINSKILLMGLTYKENLANVRGSGVNDIVSHLISYNVEIYGHDPLLKREEINNLGVTPWKGEKVDCVIISVPHNAFKNMPLKEIKNFMNNPSVLVDLGNIFNREDALKEGFYYISW
jgi:UDP-N-acetyl-D-glucosamine/UDP-N-acetyl-D-galactosamine dehydrogenase